MSGPTIRRAARPEQRFYILSKDISENDGLSWQARGLLVFLLGKPDNWQVNVAHLTKCTANAKKKTGRDGVFAILDELIEAGYIQREQHRGEAGTFGSISYIVNEEPAPLSERTVRAKPEKAANDPGIGDEPHPGKPDAANPDTAEPKAAAPDTGLPGTADPTLTRTDSLPKTDSVSKTDPNNPAAPDGEQKLLDEVAAIQKRWAPRVDKPEGLDVQTWRDFLQPRVTQRKELTPTAMGSIVNAAAKAGLTTNEAILFAAERGWLAFRYDYWLSATGGGRVSASHRPAGSLSGSAARVASGFDSLDNFDDGLDLQMG